MARPRGKRRRPQSETTLATTARIGPPERGVTEAASAASPAPNASNGSQSYIRELGHAAEAGVDPAAVSSKSSPPVVDDDTVSDSIVDALFAPDLPALDNSAPANDDAMTSPAASIADEFDIFEHRLAGRRNPMSQRARRVAVGAVGLIGIVGAIALAWPTIGRHMPRPVATRTPPTRAGTTAAPTARQVPAVAVVAVPVAAPIAAPVEAPLDSTAVVAQPTETLTALLTTAMDARGDGVRAASTAMQAWIDAGGNDAPAVARFAYWLGRRSELQLAEQWAERAVTMDASSQTAWYVLGAMRLEDPHQSRSAAFEALRRCAALPGPYGTECRGPLTNGFINQPRR